MLDRRIEEMYKKKIEVKMQKGMQNTSIPFFVGNAKYYGIDADEALSIIREMWQGKFEKTDEHSFWNAWRDSKTEPASHYGDKKRAHPEEPEERIANTAFRKFVETASPKPMAFDEWSEQDTSILKWWFKRADWIHVVSDKFDGCEKAADSKVLIESAKPMKFFQLMSLASFEDGLGRRKNSNVKENRLVLLECDKLPLEVQLKLFFTLIDFGLPVKSITYSGGKSYHCLLKIHPIREVDAYKRYCEKIFSELNKLHPCLVDAANKDGVRYTRAPFGLRKMENGKSVVQDLIWCDRVEMDDEKFEFEDTLQQVEKFVGMFTSQVKDAEKTEDANGHVRYEFSSSLADGCEIEDSFICNGAYFIKLKGIELQRICKSDLWSSFSGCIDKSIIEAVIDSKDEKHKAVTLDDFYWKVKDIVYDISQKEDGRVYNMFEPGFYTQCIGRECTEMPSEFSKLLHNIADDECREWLVNHLACYFHLLMNGFEHPHRGSHHALETVPVLYGKSGTGKNTLIDVIGRAICKKGAVDISISNLNDDFNAFYKAGLININEAAKGKTERRATKEALKRFTDQWKELNQKFMPQVTLFNGAYKTISANESDFGVLDIDQFDRRFQYITGGWQKNGAREDLVDMKLLKEQEHDFIAYLIHYECDFEKAERTFDNEAKREDKLMSMSNPEKIAYWMWENADLFNCEWFTVRVAVEWYNKMNGTKTEVDPRMMGKCLRKMFTEKTQLGKSITYEGWTMQRGERAFKKSSRVEDSISLEEL